MEIIKLAQLFTISLPEQYIIKYKYKWRLISLNKNVSNTINKTTNKVEYVNLKDDFQYII